MALVEICAPIVARRIQAVVLRVLTSRTRFSELEPVHQSRSMFRANMGGVIVAVKIFAKQWEHYEERSFNEQACIKTRLLLRAPLLSSSLFLLFGSYMFVTLQDQIEH